MRCDFDVPTSSINSLHGPSTPEQAEKELEKFFPINEQTVALIKPGLSIEQKSKFQIIRNQFRINSN